jgi:hypothetical protein
LPKNPCTRRRHRRRDPAPSSFIQNGFHSRAEVWSRPNGTAIVHGTWDFSTPLENALELAPYFKRGKLVTVVGGTHGALGEAIRADSAFADAFWTFLRTGDVAVFPDSVVLPPIEWVVPADLEETAAIWKRGRR